MKKAEIVNLEQNTPQWLEWRKTTFGASDCAAMLGISPYKTRAELLREKITGARPITAWQSALFEEGHQAEQEAIKWLEELIGEPLINSVLQRADNISASLDGLSFSGDVLVEHKLYRESTASEARFKMAKENLLSDYDMAQVQQQLLVSGAKKALFVVSDGTEKNSAIAEILPNEEWFERIIKGWREFAEALESARDEITAILAQEYKNTERKIEELIERKEELRAALILKAEKLGGELFANGLTVRKVESKGAVDYKKIPQLQGVDLEEYRKPNITSWRITGA